jgi:hypothetical protein
MILTSFTFCPIAIRMTIYPWVWVNDGTVPTWEGYEHTFISMVNTHTLRVKLKVGHGIALYPQVYP